VIVQDRADKIPSSKNGKHRERKHVMKVPNDNGHPSRFIRKCDSQRKMLNNRERNEQQAAVFVVLPYVKGLPERITRVLQRETDVAVGRLQTGKHSKSPLPEA
jgi:hypothetical protein